MQRVLISGGSGLVGQRLTQLLQLKAYEVSHLSRSKAKGNIPTILWDVEKMQINTNELEGFDCIIHLAGAGVMDSRWTSSRKDTIERSRVDSTLLLKNAIEQLNKKPKCFISASAVGYYGLNFNESVYKEEDSPGYDFLAKTCIAWESAIDQVADLGITVSKIRIGLVLTKEGGALEAIAKPIHFGLGSILGSGKQYMPWIHIDDLCHMFIYAFENKLYGAYNGVSGEEIDNRKFTKNLAKILKKPLWLPNAPSFFLKFLLGERADLILKGNRVSSDKIRNEGFEFKFLTLEDALKEIYSN